MDDVMSKKKDDDDDGVLVLDSRGRGDLYGILLKKKKMDVSPE